jgi:hypothetical protein
LEQVACCLIRMARKKIGIKPSRADLLDRLNVWCEAWAPDTCIKLRRDAVRDVWRRPRIDKADEVAKSLNIGLIERTRLKLTTIGACDVTRNQRAKLAKIRKRDADRQRAALKRAKARAKPGAVTRAEYLAKSLSRMQPWEAEGVSRRTWERRRKAA